jgi:nitrous oxidase accessory protein
MARMLLAGVLLLSLALAAGHTERSGVYGQTPGQSLQAAIDAAQAGDTITVTGGTYHERITIDKPLTLGESAGPSSTATVRAMSSRSPALM